MWYGITLAIGIILLTISIVKLRDSIQFVKAGKKTIAVVHEMESWKNSEGTTQYKPIFRFRADDGKEYTYRHIVSTSPPSWSVGEQATLIYDSEDPNEAKLLTYFGAFMWSIVLMAISMPLIIVGGGYYVAKMYFRRVQ